jgi:hypothetical protein
MLSIHLKGMIKLILILLFLIVFVLIKSTISSPELSFAVRNSLLKRLQFEENITNKRKFVTNRSPVNKSDPIWYLERFGYLNNDDNDDDDNKSKIKTMGSLLMLPNLTNTNDYIKNQKVKSAIQKFQRQARLKESGELDNETLNAMKIPRCGHPDKINKKKEPRTKRFILQGSKWSNNNLTFKVSQYPLYGYMKHQHIKDELTRALNLWSHAADVNFNSFNEQNIQSRPDIEIKFLSGYHGNQ